MPTGAGNRIDRIRLCSGAMGHLKGMPGDGASGRRERAALEEKRDGWERGKGQNGGEGKRKTGRKRGRSGGKMREKGRERSCGVECAGKGENRARKGICRGNEGETGEEVRERYREKIGMKKTRE